MSPIAVPGACSRRFLLAVLASMGASAVRAAPAGADEAAAWTALRRGGVIAFMRHADAPGIGDPPGWRLEDCTTQRNLSERGRADARAVGAMLRRERIAIDRVASSPWCRCLDTARLVDAGPVNVEPAFSNAYVLGEQRESLAERGRAVAGRWRGPGVLLVVSHGENILAMTGRSPAPAEIVVAVAEADGTLREIGALPAPRR